METTKKQENPADIHQKDPVCGMMVEAGESTPMTEFDKAIYYFCNPNCMEKFEKDPGVYIEKQEQEKARELASF